MKAIRINSIILFITCLLIFAGCSKDFIDKPVQPGTQSDVSFRKTAQGLLYTLNTAYSPLAGSQWQQYPLNWMILGEHRSDDSQAGGEDENDDVPAHAVNDFNIYSTNGVFSDLWRTCYNGIHYANAVVYSAPGALELATPADAILINKYVGEAKCMRAYYYFDLVRQFGDLPLVLDASLTFRPRTDRLLIYDQIEKDLTEAAAALPKATELKPEDKGRMNNGSALAILAKVYLFRASIETDKATDYYTKAYETAKQVIDSKQFKLLSTYDAIWRNTGDFSTEGIVEGGQPVPAATTSAASYWFGIYQSPRYYYALGTRTKASSTYGWGFNCPTQDFVNAFETGDPRLHWTVFFAGDSAVQGNTKSIKQAICFDNSKTGYYLRKYTPEYSRTSMENPLNIKYYRYSDLLLVGAEAANEINKQTDALDWLEQVRARARNTRPEQNHRLAPDYVAGVPVMITTTDQGQLRDIIRHERRIELGMEAHRFYDLVRWDGTFGFDWKTTIQGAQLIPGPNYQIDNDDKSGLPRTGRVVVVEGRHKLSPVPDGEIKASSNTLSQNPGY
jgi:starch-binding outer membrane protein, SusD/RagB family